MEAEESRDAELRLVLVGSQRFGGNAVASSILGMEGPRARDWGPRTARSVTRSAEVNGTCVQLVKAPVWLRSYHLQDTAELVKQELVLSLSHTRPGPHAFILLCEVDLPFTSACARSITAHLNLLGPHVWEHTLVLFTCGDWLGQSSLDEYLDGEGHHLAQLLDRCSHRYLMDCTSAPALSHRLLTKVQELLSANGGKHFQIDEAQIQRIVLRREEVTRRAEQRRRRREEKRKTKPGAFISEITIMLLGWVFAAKTSVYGALCPSHLPEVSGKTNQCVTGSRRETCGSSYVSLTVVDIPGWWKFFDARLVPSGVREQINKAFEKVKGSQQTESSRRAFLLMLPADTSFTQEQLQILTSNLQPLGESVWDWTIVVFTGGHWVKDLDIELHIEAEGEALVWLVERCQNRYYVFETGTDQTLLETQGNELIQMVLDMCGRKKDSGQDLTEVLTKVPPVVQKETMIDPDLKKMVEVLHQVWEWSEWEIQEIKHRLELRPILQAGDKGSMHFPPEMKTESKGSSVEGGPVLGTTNEFKSVNRSRVEFIVRDETDGKSLEDLLKIVKEIYFRRECGAFDIVSIICDNEQFKPEWRSLFEREWARREEILMEYVFVKHFGVSDEQQRQKESTQRVEAWLKSLEHPDWVEGIEEPSIKEPVTNIIYRVKPFPRKRSLEQRSLVAAV